MRAARLATLVFALSVAARADFSYTSTRKTTGGMMASMAGGANGTSKVYFKGKKMKSEEGDTSTILDFDARTVTTINNAAKTYTVRSLSDAAPAQSQPGVSIDVKETGQRKTINGFDAKEVVLTMEIDLSQGRGTGGKAQAEAHLWLASDVPGAGEMRAFYQANASRIPAAGMQAAIGEIQNKIATLDGVPVEEVIVVKPAGGAGMPGMPGMPQMTSAQSAQLDQARARLEALEAQGGPAAAAAQQALSRMNQMGAGRGAAPAASSSSLIELTIDETDFSSSAIPDSVFAIPAGYTKTETR
ncbi:MAG TPA: DUF4412 domain-containing protein [Bryobacteraceae bacterium]|nr:DUF4412 domain-containing protein [Bryobacteraceae bacterium]